MTDAHDEQGGQVDEHPPAPDPAEFPDGDELDSAAIEEPGDGYTPPADPDAEPVDEPDDGAPGGDA